MVDNKNKNKPFTKFKKCLRKCLGKLKFTTNVEYELDFNNSPIDKHIDEYFMYHVNDNMTVKENYE